MRRDQTLSGCTDGIAKGFTVRLTARARSAMNDHESSKDINGVTV